MQQFLFLCIVSSVMKFNSGRSYGLSLNYLLTMLLAVSASVLFLISGCRKDENHSAEPIINLISPTESDYFNVFDTVFIKATVRHNIKVSKVSFSITDEKLKRLVGGPVLVPDTNQFDIDAFMVINNKYIEATANYLLIEVEDGNELFNYWYDLKIYPLDKELTGLTVVTESPAANGKNALLSESDIQSRNFNVYRVKTDGNYTRTNIGFGEYSGGYSDSRYELFYSAGFQDEGITAFDVNTGNPKWNIPAQTVGSIPWFSSFDATEGQVSAGLYDGSVETYDQDGLIRMKSAKLPGGRFSKVVNFDKWVAGVFSPFDGTGEKLFVFNNPAGNQYDKVSLPGNPVALIPSGKSTMLFIINESGTNKAYTYKFADKQFSYLHEISADTIYRSAGEGENIFFISDNSIKWYKPEIGSTVDYIPIPAANAIAFDSISNLLVVGKGRQLYLYTLPNTTASSVIELPEDIADIRLNFNK